MQTSRSTTCSSTCTMCSIQTMAMPRRRRFLDGVDQFARLAVGQAAADLIEQQHARPGRQRAGQLQPLAVEQAERFGAPVGERQHAAQPQRLRCTRSHASPCAGRRSGWRRPTDSRTPSCRRTGAGSGACARCRGGSAPALAGRVTSSPRNTHARRHSAACAPESTLSSVVLPAPFGPTMPTASSARIAKVDAVEHHERIEPLVEFPRLKNGASSGRRQDRFGQHRRGSGRIRAQLRLDRHVRVGDVSR